MAYRVEIDKDRCISSGKCVADEPAAFAFDADELAEVRPGAVELTDARLVVIARRCPGEAISLHDADGRPVELG